MFTVRVNPVTFRNSRELCQASSTTTWMRSYAWRTFRQNSFISRYNWINVSLISFAKLWRLIIKRRRHTTTLNEFLTPYPQSSPGRYWLISVSWNVFIKNPGNFDWNANETKIIWALRLDIVDYVLRWLVWLENCCIDLLSRRKR